MNFYDAKKQNLIERMRARAMRLDAIAEQNSMNMFREENSGIPFGQPILVGHHSEGRHRRHLARLEARLVKGFAAHDKANELRERAQGAESREAIDSNNPEALKLLNEKLLKLQEDQARNVKINKFVRKCKDENALAAMLIKEYPTLKDPQKLAKNLLTPYLGRVGVPSFTLSNNSAEIRRIKQRIEVLGRIQNNFEAFEIRGVKVELVEGQVQVDFPSKPNDETRSKLKRSPLALKWSRYSGRWVRKHTPATAGRAFKETLKEVLEVWA